MYRALRRISLSLTLMSLTPVNQPLAQSPVNTSPSAIRLHRAVATERGFDANAWWLETDDGLVLIDALMLRSDAQLLVAAMKSTGKPLRAVIITHAHADHFGGLPHIRAAYPGVPVVATRPTIDGMHEVHREGMVDGGWLRAFGAEYDSSVVVPDRVVSSGDTLRYAGVTLVIRDYGPMESHNNSVVFVPQLNALFTGDATVHGASYYVGTMDAEQAVRALPRLLSDHPGDVIAYAGHYGPRRLAHTVADNLAQLRQLHASAALIGSASSNRAADGDLTLAAKRQLLLITSMHTAERADYGIGAVGMARYELPAIVASLRAKGRTDSSVATTAVRDGMRPLLFLIGVYDHARFTVGPGGLYIDATAQSAGYRYHLSFSYDHVQRRYRVVSRDEISGLIDVFEGERTAEGALVVSNVGTGTHYLNEKREKVFNRMHFIPVADGQWTWRVESGRGDGAWSQVLEQTMQRRPLR